VTTAGARRSQVFLSSRRIPIRLAKDASSGQSRRRRDGRVPCARTRSGWGNQVWSHFTWLRQDPLPDLPDERAVSVLGPREELLPSCDKKRQLVGAEWPQEKVQCQAPAGIRNSQSPPSRPAIRGSDVVSSRRQPTETIGHKPRLKAPSSRRPGSDVAARSTPSPKPPSLRIRQY